MSTIIQSNLSGGKKVVCGGGGGSVSGAASGSTQSVTLFTTPATPADAEYLVTVGGVVGSGAQNETQAADVGLVSTTLLVGPSAPVAVAFCATGAWAYTFNYRYCAYRNT